MKTNKQIKLEEVKTIEELKALAFDFILQRDVIQNNLNLVKQEIDKRSNVSDAQFEEK